MKEFIEREKARLQEVFRIFNERGALMALLDGKGETEVRLGLVDSFLVTRVAPKFDAGGNHTGSDFWLLWKAVGYHEGFQHAHTVKVLKWWRDDGYMLDFVDDRDRRHHAEYPMDCADPEAVRDWRAWQRFKAANAAMFAAIDAELLEEHAMIAEEWE
jgi:hypothetical protein